MVYLTVVTYNIQYLQYFCDDIENSCIMNLKWLRLQSIFLSRQHILSMAQNFVFSTDSISLFCEWRLQSFVCMQVEWSEEYNNIRPDWTCTFFIILYLTLVKTWTTHLFLSLSANSPHIFSEHLAFVPFRFFGYDGSVTETFLYRFREHYKRWIWSISLKHLTKRPSASYWAFCGCTDQLKMLTSFL